MNASTHGGEVFAAARLRSVPPDRILDFSANINPLGPSPKAVRRLRRDLSLIRFYPDSENRELRDLVANKAAIPEECILFGNGATALLHLLPRVLKPRSAVILEPSFSEYSLALKREGCRIHRLFLRPDRRFQPDREALLDALRRIRPNLLLLGNPNNPTGNVLPDPLLAELIDACSRRRIHLVLDESFIDFTRYTSRAFHATKHPRVVVIRSLTKFWALAGLRIGYLVAHRSLVEKLAAGLEAWSVNTLASAAAAESLRDVKHRDKTLNLIRRERTFLIEQLVGLGWLEPYSSETNFLLVHITTPGISSTFLREKLAEHSILIRDASNFLGLGRSYFRIAVRRRSENRRLIEALRAISSGIQRAQKQRESEGLKVQRQLSRPGRGY